MSYDRKFAEFATRVAFNLTLTRTQIQYMVVISRLGEGTVGVAALEAEVRGPRGQANPDWFIPAARALEQKGLVEHNPAWKTRAGPKKGQPRWVYRLTPAGEHVMALLQIAGLVAGKPANEETSDDSTRTLHAG